MPVMSSDRAALLMSSFRNAIVAAFGEEQGDVELAGGPPPPWTSAVGRARPSYADCKANPSFSPDCDVPAADSFPSGHTNDAFTAAGLSCAHHSHLPIYGSRLADTLTCIPTC
jgi:membrane-associated phospholipid phosphatase